MRMLHTTIAVAVVALLATICNQAVADPLPGEVLKFQQLPLNNGVSLVPGVVAAPYPGHDEWSTALLTTPAPNVDYQGDFMADDFADNFSTPVVHVRWWGSYDQNINGNNGVQKFLISFESDVPAPAGGFSQPGTPLLTQVVTPGALTPASGTFTETLINGNVPEHLYQYNAELALPFAEQKDTVYWLKIVALVDPATDGAMKWGWHDRDWSINDLALASPVPTPGENIEGQVITSAGPTPVWHFQDDAVSGQIDAGINTAGVFGINRESGFTPQNYLDPNAAQGPIDGPPGIGNFSKDLAFELYTTGVPEPSTIVLFGLGGLGLAARLMVKRRQVR